MAKHQRSLVQLAFDFPTVDQLVDESASPSPKSKSLPSSTQALNDPSPYTGLYGFHKYWGKKPVEALRFLISELTDEDDLVVDPFLGAGAIARESAHLGRRFIGGDINPVAIHLSRFFLKPCAADDYAAAIAHLVKQIRPLIDASYTVEPYGTPSHFLWEEERLMSIWQRGEGKQARSERFPTPADIKLAETLSDYQPQMLRHLRFFQNSRINATDKLDWNALFSGRALRNIELLKIGIQQFDGPVREALDLTLTASAGQMSKMVFAITSRGKTKGITASRIEVGSWVIGYWCPKTHFEINVWNCFESRGRKLQKALNNITFSTVPSPLQDVLARNATVCIEKIDAVAFLRTIPSGSIQLLITDPPHGDRIPYLELSEMWNGLLGEESLFDQEIGVSNAKGRGKTPEVYQTALDQFFDLATDRIKDGGFLVLMFNSRHDEDWLAIRGITANTTMKLVGCFPMEYSATSGVQDNRKGGMKNDFILLYSKGKPLLSSITLLESIPGWLHDLPK